jgi:hypothetical protein
MMTKCERQLTPIVVDVPSNQIIRAGIPYGPEGP